jgi:hypothetical protein
MQHISMSSFLTFATAAFIFNMLKGLTPLHLHTYTSPLHPEHSFLLQAGVTQQWTALGGLSSIRILVVAGEGVIMSMHALQIV